MIKTKEEIEELVLEKFKHRMYNPFFNVAFVEGYTQCQEDMADKKEWIDKMMSRSVCSIPNKSYTIEEIEKAIVDAHNNNRIYWTWDSIKKQIINNLKK